MASGVPPSVPRLPLSAHLNPQEDAHSEPISLSRHGKQMSPSSAGTTYGTAINGSPKSRSSALTLPILQDLGSRAAAHSEPISESRSIEPITPSSSGATHEVIDESSKSSGSTSTLSTLGNKVRRRFFPPIATLTPPREAKPSSGSGDRCSAASDSPSSALESKTVLDLKALTLDSGSCSETLPAEKKEKPDLSYPGYLSYRLPDTEHHSQVRETHSVHLPTASEADETLSPCYSHRPLVFTPRPQPKAPDEPIHQMGESSSSSNRSGPPSPPFCFEEIAPELHLMTDKKKNFSTETAAQEVADCLERPGGKELVLSIFSLYHHVEKEKRIAQRWQLLLTSTLLYPQPKCIDLVYAFLEKEGILPIDFAHTVVEGFLCKETPPLHVSYILSSYTEEDLKSQKEDTLFRIGTLSSFLYSGYGNYLLDNHLTSLKKTILNYWKKTPPTAHCLDERKIYQHLLKSDKKFKGLSEEEKNTLCKKTVEINKASCREFFHLFLKKLYSTPLPEEFQDLLSRRRKGIFNYCLSKGPFLLEAPSSPKETQKRLLNAQKTSQVVICEVLFVRIINPYLINIGKDEAQTDALKNLTILIQTICNQNKEEGKSESKKEVFESSKMFFEESFNDLYDTFIHIHRKYIDENFPIRLSPRTDLA